VQPSLEHAELPEPLLDRHRRRRQQRDHRYPAQQHLHGGDERQDPADGLLAHGRGEHGQPGDVGRIGGERGGLGARDRGVELGGPEADDRHRDGDRQAHAEHGDDRPAPAGGDVLEAHHQRRRGRRAHRDGGGAHPHTDDVGERQARRHRPEDRRRRLGDPRRHHTGEEGPGGHAGHGQQDVLGGDQRRQPCRRGPGHLQQGQLSSNSPSPAKMLPGSRSG
jgi:hypothetical protein